MRQIKNNEKKRFVVVLLQIAQGAVAKFVKKKTK